VSQDGPLMRVLALDYGRARTGVAVSDASRTLARPLGVIERAHDDAGLDAIAGLVAEHGADTVVVGMPLTLRGERGEQARETERFIARLRERVDVEVESYDERFTTALAGATRAASEEDAVAAAHLLQGWLHRDAARR
jgi:putative transcription antitermination factor YqgF